MSNKNDITGDKIISKQATLVYEEQHVAIFGERKLQEYSFYIFDRSASKQTCAKIWSLRFPNNDTAIYHAKKNNADKVTLNGVILAEKIDVGCGVYIFKKAYI